ncbi:alpha-amylase family glycosyl hydrolase, partial [Alteromonas sp. 14N.309.X.WAT.G.H12]|uniref:alpha-amylase family glycosyl hydrolase n=1 Tax=Alteromonas sp. 14N.309.X.WAT.G.H12 TaxID=3120824 RepID=UPI002FD49D23
EELKQFIHAAHSRNIKVFFDIITNHTADIIKYQECHGSENLLKSTGQPHCEYKPTDTLATDNYTPYIPQGEDKVKVPAWLNDSGVYHNQGDSNWEGESAVNGDFAGLDDLDTSQAEVVSGMTDIYKNIISRFKPDGFRIDTVKHVDMTFWQQFSPALMNYAKTQGIENFMMFGEVYSFDVSLLSQYINKAKLPSVLDFAFQGALESVLVKQEGTDVLAALFAQDNLYHHEQGYDANDLVNFTGNHDMGRFAYKLKQSEFNYTDAQMTQRTQLAYAMIYFCRGVPVIYYGDEQGFVGDGGDQDSRQDMMPSFVASYNDDDLLATEKTTADDNFDPSHPLYNAFARYASLYQQYPALRRGKQSVLYGQSTPGLFAIAREYTDDNGVSQRIAVVFNTSDKPQNINLPQLDKEHLLYASDLGQGAMEGLSFRLYQLN